MPILRNLAFTIPRSEVLRRLQYNVHLTKMPESIDTLITNMIEEGSAIAEAALSYQTFEIAEKQKEKTILAGTDYFLEGSSLAIFLKDSYKVTLLVCTVGSSFTERSEQYLTDGEVTKAAIIDAVGSEAVEALSERASAIIAQEAKTEQAKTTWRFSPGYGNWTLESQSRMLTLLESEHIGVTTNEKHLMIPEKTISACVGWIRVPGMPVRDSLNVPK